MRHPTDGTLRRLLDEPAGVADADRDHIAGCPVCLTGVADARRDAAFAEAALTPETALTAEAVAPDVERGWQRLSASLDQPHGATASETPARRAFVGLPARRGRAAPGAPGAPQEASSRWWAARGGPRGASPHWWTAPRGPQAASPRWRALLRSPVVAVLAVLALLGGATAAAATDWFPIFRTEKIAPVTISQADLLALPDLSAYGDVAITEPARIRRVAGAADARAATGLSVPEVAELPRGVSGQPTYQVGERVSASFTFSAARTARAATAAPAPPPGLDGSRFRLTAGPGVAAVWSEDRGVPSLIVARAVAPKAFSTGVPFETARDYLLSLSGLPEDVAAQLRRFSADGRTLPVHVLAEELTSSSAEVGGTPATVFATRDGVLAAVVWVTDGVITAVAGSLSTDEVLSVARGLTWSK